MIDELHSLQKKKSVPTTPIKGTQGVAFAVTISEDERHKQQLQSISASLASLISSMSNPETKFSTSDARTFLRCHSLIAALTTRTRSRRRVTHRSWMRCMPRPSWF
ncbi:hypothetical protein PS2_015008 [Malus domestica]